MQNQINEEILKIIDIINDYYNEINLDGKIKVNAINIAQKILEPYHKKKIKDLDNYYKKLYSRTTNYHVKDHSKDFAYSYFRLFKGWKNTYLSVKHRNNINLVLKDLKKTDKYLSKKINVIYKNFRNKFEKYLNNYSTLAQNLYLNLYNYVENKISNSIIIPLLNDYNSNFNLIISEDSNNNLFIRINNESVNIFNNMETDLKILANNSNLIEREYFSETYLNSYENFLEYPKEIIHKINQFLDEIKEYFEHIKIIIKDIFFTKAKNIIKSTNRYIKNCIHDQFKFIVSNINSNNIIEKYYLHIYDKTNKTFSSIIKIVNDYIKININNNDNKENSSLEYYNNKYEQLINKTRTFIVFLENLIDYNFTKNICYIEEVNQPFSNTTNETRCNISKKEFDPNLSKYNYNIVKLRTGIYYTKDLIENIYLLIDFLNIKNLISIEKINNYDNLINSKNIFHIYNETNYMLDSKNKESVNFLKEYLEYFHEDFKNKYSYKNDYFPFIEKFKEILNLKNDNFNNNITLINERVLNNSLFILDLFNGTLSEQLALRFNYDLYNFNETYFQEIKIYYNSLLEQTFIYYKNTVNNLKNSYKFHNSIKSLLRKQQKEKRNYFKEIINNFSLKYDFNLLNMTYNLGQYETKILKKEYDDYEFIYIYDYVEIFENNTSGYIRQIVEKIENIEEIIKQKFKDIYNNFYNNYYRESNHEIDIYYLNDLNNNYTICKKYTYDILLNYSRYNNTENEFNNSDDAIYYNIINIINITFQNCFYKKNSVIEIETFNISLIEKINYILNKSNVCFDDSENFKNFSNFNETMDLFDCYKNNFYNYSAFYFTNFNETIKNKLDNYINNISLIIKNNIVDDNFLNEFLENNYKLDNYKELDLSDMFYNFEDIESMINYLNYLDKADYKTLLNNLLINSFNISYNDLVNNYLLDELVDDISYSIIYILELNIDYIANKTKKEFYYYLLLLEGTEQLGESSKKALINQYQYMKDKLNESFYYLIQDDIYFYLNIFYRENKKLFRNNFINYYKFDLNKYEITINKLSEFLDELLIERQFNTSLDSISKHLIENIILKKIKEKIEISINNKVNNLYNNLDIYMNDMTKIVNQKETKELPNDMENLVQIIIKYSELVNNQKSHFTFSISENPFNILYNFVKYNLEPPLILIKDQYNSIEERLLAEIEKIVNTFPDNYLFVREKLGLELIHDNISFIIENLRELFKEYNTILYEDLMSYLNKLVHYTYINGTITYDSPCKYSFCKINLNFSNNNDETRRLSENKEEYILREKPNITEIKKSINRKIRILSEYDHTMGPITRNDVISLLLNLEQTLYEFNKTYLKNEYREINRNSVQYFNKINSTYLIKLKRTIDMVSLKFSTFLTDNSYNFFKNIVYNQYNKIEFYINNNSDLIENKKNEALNLLNNSSVILKNLFNLSYNNVYNMYEIFYSTIESKIEYNSKKKSEKNNVEINEGGEFGLPFVEDEMHHNQGAGERFHEIKDIFLKFFPFSKQETENNIQKSLTTLDKISKFMDEHNFELSTSIGMNSEFFTHIKSINIGNNFCINFNPYIKPYNYSFFTGSYIELAFVIRPNLEAGICLEMGFDLNWNIKKYSFYIDAYGKAEASVSLEVGAYVPSVLSPIQVSLSLGIKGILGSGRAGIKLSLFIGECRYDTKIYFELNAFVFSFYILFRFSADLKFYKISFEFYILNKLLAGYKFEAHSIAIRYYNSTRKMTVEGISPLSFFYINSWKTIKNY